MVENKLGLTLDQSRTTSS